MQCATTAAMTAILRYYYYVLALAKIIRKPDRIKNVFFVQNALRYIWRKTFFRETPVVPGRAMRLFNDFYILFSFIFSRQQQRRGFTLFSIPETQSAAVQLFWRARWYSSIILYIYHHDKNCGKGVFFFFCAFHESAARYKFQYWSHISEQKF